MRSYIRTILLTSSLVITVSAIKLSAQSPWTPGHKKGYSHLAISSIFNYDQVFEGNFQNLTPLDGSISEYTIQSYTEIGFGERIGAIVSVPLRSIRSTFEQSTTVQSGNVTGLGNIDLGLKYKILDGPLTSSVGLMTSLNTGRESKSEEEGLRTGYDALGFTPFVSIGKGFDQAYLYGNIGYEINSNDFSDYFKFGIEYGRKYWSKLWIIAAFNMREIALETEKSFAPAQMKTRLYINNQFYNSLSLKLIYERDSKSGFNFSANLISLRANNLPFRSPLAIGYYRKW